MGLTGVKLRCLEDYTSGGSRGENISLVCSNFQRLPAFLSSWPPSSKPVTSQLSDPFSHHRISLTTARKGSPLRRICVQDSFLLSKSLIPSTKSLLPSITFTVSRNQNGNIFPRAGGHYSTFHREGVLSCSPECQTRVHQNVKPGGGGSGVGVGGQLLKDFQQKLLRIVLQRELAGLEQWVRGGKQEAVFCLEEVQGFLLLCVNMCSWRCVCDQELYVYKLGMAPAVESRSA